MKRTIWINKWLVAVLAIGVVWSHTLPLSAEDGDPENVSPPVAETNLVETNDVAPAPVEIEQAQNGQRHGRSQGDIVVFGRSVEVKAGETAKDVVVIFGSATVRGKANDVVAIFGSVNIEGESKDTVAILGNVKLGTNANVHGDAVAVMGNVRIATNAAVRGDVVSVGGSVDQSENADVGGQIVGLPGISWLGDYLEQCVYKLRPLAPQLGWLWVVTGVFFVLYLLIAIAFPRPVNACVEEISRRPATTFLIGLMTKILLLPIVTLILVITGIGVFLIPFLSAAVMFAGIVGKIALLQYFGQQVGRQFGATSLQKPVLAFVFGWVIITLLYLVPIVGFIVFGVTGLWAIGAAVMAMFGGARREMPPSQPSPPPQTMPGTAVPAMPAFAAGTTTAATTEHSGTPMAGATEAGTPPAPMSVPTGLHTTTSEVLAFPRASFWERMGAGFLDIILVSILSAVVGGLPLGFLVALAYFAGMWAWRGTTIGGIVLNLKVVRYDGQPMNFAVALVRSLMAAFSMIVLFLGFFWIAWDRERQGWHDKIAGTIVVRQPHGTPLLCL